jgi:predicted ATPase
MALAATHYYSGNFEEARRAAISGIGILHSGDVQAQVEELDEPAIACLCHEALCAWHFGESSCHAPIDEAIALAKKIGDTHGLAVALYFGTILGHFERNPAEVESRGADLIELSTRQGFVHFLPLATILLGWARGMSGQTSQAISWIEDGMEKLRTSGGVLCWPYLLALKAEPLHLAGRTAEALEVINEAEAIAEQSGELWWCADLQRLRSVFLAALGAEDARVANSFRDAIRTARDQKSISLETRAEQAYADYRAKKGENGRRMTGTASPAAKRGS